MAKEILNKHMFMVPRQFSTSSLLMPVHPFSLLEGDDGFSITHPFSGFRFCVINYVSAQKLLSVISVICLLDTRKAHTAPYNELCYHMWDFFGTQCAHTSL